MATTHVSTRRSFMTVAGAALSAPLAAAAATLPAHAAAGESLEARLAHLEDLNAIRALNQAYAKDILADRLDADGAVEVALDRRTATARLRGTVWKEREIGPGCTLVEMARQQGEGFVRWTEPVVLEVVYVRRDGVWEIGSTSASA